MTKTIDYKVVPKDVYNTIIKSKHDYEIVHVLAHLSTDTLEAALKSSMLKWKVLSVNNELTYTQTRNIATCMVSCGLCNHFDTSEYDIDTEDLFDETDCMDCDCAKCHENTGFEKELCEERELYDGPTRDPDGICFKALFDYVEVMKEDFYTHEQHKVKAAARLIRDMMYSKLKEIQQSKRH